MLLTQSGALFRALRPSTRVWYDVIAPLAMIVAMVGTDVGLRAPVAVVAAVALFHGGQTLFNDVADVEVDRASTEKSRTTRAAATGALTRRSLISAGWVLVVLSLLLAWWASWVSFLVLLMAVPTVLSYNFRSMGGISGRPLWTQIFWPVTWVMIYVIAAGALSFRGWQTGVVYLLFVVIFMGIGEGLCQDIRDVDNDAAGGRTTTVVRYGVPACALWAWGAFLASAVPLALFTGRFGLVPLLLCLSVLGVWVAICWRYVVLLRTGDQRESGRAMHVGSILTFSVLNVLVILSAVLTA